MKTLFAAAAATAVLAACGSSGPETCQTDADCKTGQICNQGLCYLPVEGQSSSGGSSTGQKTSGTTGTEGSSTGASSHGSTSGGTTGNAASSSSGTTGAVASSTGALQGSTGSSAGTTGGGSSGGSSTGGGTTGAPPAPLGSACSQGSDCQGGYCLPWGANGYCSGPCSTNSDCGTGGVCEPDYFDSPDGGLPISVCALGCTSSSTCPTGDVCDTRGSQGFCAPNDCRVDPSICSGTDECNQNTGACTASTLPSGYPASFPAVPQVQNAGGTVITNPTYVAMYFSNDDDPGAPVSDLQAFFEGVGQTNYWQVLNEYGVNPPASVVQVSLGQAAPSSIDDTDQGSALQTLLSGFIEAGTGGTPQEDGSTIYILVFPQGTTITDGSGSSCSSFGGNNSEMTGSGRNGEIPYIVLPRCPVTADDGFENDLQIATSAASHEMIEAATDPFPGSSPAYSQCDNGHLYFDEANGGSEVADMCENDPEAYWIFPDFAFVVQRIWSNEAAQAGWDPCVPAYTDEVYFNGAPTLPDTTRFDYTSNVTADDSANIQQGNTGTVTVQVYSDGPSAAPITVQVFDWACLISGSTTSDVLSFTLASGASGATCGAAPSGGFACVTQQCTGLTNGDTVTVSVDVTGNGGNDGEVSGTELFGVLTSQGTGADEFVHIWWGLIGS